MVIDDALGIAGRARGVVERDRVPFVARHAPGEVRLAGSDELLVVDRAQPLAGAGEFGVVVVDDQRLHLGERERLAHEPGEFAVGDQHLRFGMVEREGDDGGVEPGVECVEHRSRHRHAVVAFEHAPACWRASTETVSPRLMPRRASARGEPARAGVELGVAAPQRPVDDRGMVGKHLRRPLEERQRRQRLEIRGIAVEINVVGRHRVIQFRPCGGPATVPAARNRRNVALGPGAPARQGRTS